MAGVRTALDELSAIVRREPDATLITASREVEHGHLPVHVRLLGGAD